LRNVLLEALEAQGERPRAATALAGDVDLVARRGVGHVDVALGPGNPGIVELVVAGLGVARVARVDLQDGEGRTGVAPNGSEALGKPGRWAQGYMSTLFRSITRPGEEGK